MESAGNMIANWVPAPLTVILVLFLLKREAARIETTLKRFEETAITLTKTVNELQIMSREFVTIRSHGESVTRIYEEMRKADAELRERVLRIELGKPRRVPDE
jgi:hypothetical protein